MSWWRHQMETFSALLALCEGNPPVTDGFPPQRSETRSIDVFFDLRVNKWLSKQSRRRWFGTPLRSLWRHWNGHYQKRLRNHVIKTLSTEWLLALCDENHWSLVDKESVMRSFDIFFVVSLSQMLNELLSYRLFETPRSCDTSSCIGDVTNVTSLTLWSYVLFAITPLL